MSNKAKTQIAQHNGLTIAETVIRQDAEGRYCINDLHRAAGGEARHRPTQWLRTKIATDLVEELENSDALISASEQNQSVSVTKGGDGIQGTYVVKELVYAYAMWISAAFHLKVIRAYDALVTKPVEEELKLNDPAALRGYLLIYTEKVIALTKELEEQKPKVEFFDGVHRSVNSLSLRDAAKSLGFKPSVFKTQLVQDGLLYGKNALPYQRYIDSGYFEVAQFIHKSADGREFVRPYTRITGKGCQYFVNKNRAEFLANAPRQSGLSFEIH
ncbi:KilA-N domain-containing protein [Ferrovum myxofaciens]|uniref:Phage antirepressor KilAC domain-containing protein n=1 Tax=Ferrovum myxofaciens TaxID=416213 RepID=A0A9E6SY25_9PROT|nr:KilA-N domain-containing protein [Ferrovum myxofaciens]QKE37386.1 MAG: phage antirepressor KilAC domain-containing protein [Ferrovum myxofaciens]QWY75040.1 MAG: phage antirepressor KilAC domain-containing protein [Ferrovum myxofaciens]QWY77780.1 MAG: phage antirepressor KilAC domain-containing protein [Ferrovum myxofaciens]